ncbi:hypothetical protein GCM10027605_57560 [Micromonospora zhanjiangensis]
MRHFGQVTERAGHSLRLRSDQVVARLGAPRCTTAPRPPRRLPAGRGPPPSRLPESQPGRLDAALVGLGGALGEVVGPDAMRANVEKPARAPVEYTYSIPALFPDHEGGVALRGPAPGRRLGPWCQWRSRLAMTDEMGSTGTAITGPTTG